MSDPLRQARQQDSERRRRRVQRALAEMRTDGSDVTVSDVARRARVHRTFIYRHADLHTAILAAAEEAGTGSLPVSAKISHRSLRAENANLREQSQRAFRRIRELEERLSEVLGHEVFERSGLGAPTDVAALQAQLRNCEQHNLELKRRLEERDEELEAARETNRALMAEMNRSSSRTIA